MRSLKLFFVTGLFALSMAACGGDDDDGPTVDGAPGADSSAADGAATGAAPEITLVEWAHAAPCALNTPSEVDVTVTVTDTDSLPAELTVTGSVTTCTGALDDLESTISCPQAAPYPGTVTVTDDDGNADTVTFSIEPCADSSQPPPA